MSHPESCGAPGNKAACRTALFELSEDGLLIDDRASMRRIDANPAACRLMGKSQALALEAPPNEWPVRCTCEEARQAYDAVIAQAPKPQITEVRLDEGRMVRWLEMTRFAFQQDGLWLIATSLRDISKRKALEQRLERFKTVLDLSPDTVAMVDRNTMAYLEANHALLKATNMSREAFLQVRPYDRMKGMTREGLEAMYDEIIAASPRALVNEHIAFRANGVQVPMQVVRQAIWSEDRWIVVMIGRDVSERFASQRDEQRFRAALNLAADAILLVDRASGTCFDANETACQLYRCDRDALLMPGALETIFQSEKPLQKLMDELIACAPAALVSQEEHRRMDGSRFPCEVRRQAVLFQDQCTIVTHVRDLTEKKNVEMELRSKLDELARSNAELNRFAHVASHDLQEALRTIASFSNLLSRRYADKLDTDGREFIQYIVGGAARLQQLIHDLATYSRVSRQPAAFAPLELDLALDEALLNLKLLLEREGAQILRDPLPQVHGQKSFLIQLFQNLIQNAVKFRSQDQPRIAISLRDAGNEWHISVADNGIGISPQYFERIFVIFQRLHDRDKYEGTGAGLAICKQIVERHGGRIWVQSDGEPQSGTTFTFSLPKMAASERSAV